MKTVAIFGSGMMPPAIIDYYTHKYPCNIIIATIDLPQAQALVKGNPRCTIVEWSMDDPESSDRITQKADVVIPMVPEHVLLAVARSCLRTQTQMVYTAYQETNIYALSDEAKNRGIIFLSEMGEDPGLDHLCTVKLLDEVRAKGGKIRQLGQWGAGLPDHADNNNPMGYKFSWSPPRLYEALQAPVTYLVKGQKVQYSGGEQYQHFHYLETKWGTFESVAHRTVLRYLEAYDLDPNSISFFRGLMRHYGYCNTINAYLALGFLDSQTCRDYQGKTCAEITASFVNGSPETVERDVAQFLGIKFHDDIIYRLRWLGCFEDKPAPIEQGTAAEYLLSLQARKMMYSPDESDITLVMVRLEVEYPDGSRELKEATLRVAGIPGGFSAMTRAVGYSAGIAGKHVMEGKVKATGCVMLPELSDLCTAMREEMAGYGFDFAYQTTPLAAGTPGDVCAALSPPKLSKQTLTY
ncbi:MAG: saccharopine dehydrogenase C-terminal domain-containing protein [Jaaginema sp. PMC 1079.18]|nr:saccharopine dehydrogenase C-terminal domain-containing protein [Jaaginema sp. PMC 1080.18]MEC4850602.1 saccharopine dehydrogenase C-terminal domain-containing protein [Jaaginema sp. PMC 1079.18]MEC4865379.1 saccharopine dehydrogenase C-terminal domain-containing protein [Jaaginema sp. PMC 1078.18]